MTSRAIYEERLFTSNRPFPRRQSPDGVDPLEGRRQWHEDGSPLIVWGSFALAPYERDWEPPRPGQQAVYVSRNQVVRVALVDVATALIVDWRRTAGSQAYAPRKPRAAPDLHPLDRRPRRRF